VCVLVWVCGEFVGEVVFCESHDPVGYCGVADDGFVE